MSTIPTALPFTYLPATHILPPTNPTLRLPVPLTLTLSSLFGGSNLASRGLVPRFIEWIFGQYDDRADAAAVGDAAGAAAGGSGAPEKVDPRGENPPCPLRPTHVLLTLCLVTDEHVVGSTCYIYIYI